MDRADPLRSDQPGTPARTGGTEPAKTASGLNIAVAVWLIVATFVLGYFELTAALWNDIVIGVLVLGLAGARAANPGAAPGLSWTNAVLGLWLILAPFVLGYSVERAPLWNDVVVGLIMASLAVSSAVATPRRRPAMR